MTKAAVLPRVLGARHAVLLSRSLTLVALLGLADCSAQGAKGKGGPADGLATDAGGAGSDGADGSSNGSSDSGPADAGTDGTGPARNPKCSNYKDEDLGKKVPWEGFRYQGKLFTCNVQRGGRADMQGTWRLVDGKTEDPRTPLRLEGRPYRETLAIDGNTFVNKVSGSDLGKVLTATFSGWYWSADEAELHGEPTVFVITAAQPPSAFGFGGGSVYGATVLHDGADRMGLFDIRLDDLEKPGTAAFLYCRVGSEVLVDGKKVACTDPLE